MNTFEFEYDCIVRDLEIAGERLQIESLRSVEATIDQIFEVLQKEHRPELLEELCPYFGTIWPAAEGLTQYLVGLLGESSSTPALRVTELGCGLALPSLILAKRGHSVCCSDSHPDVPKFLKSNLKHNGLNENDLIYRSWNWMSLDEVPAPLAGSSWIIGSDILYESAHPQQVASAMSRLLDKGSTRIILADPARPYLQDFSKELESILKVTAQIHVEQCKSLNLGKEVIILDFELN